MYMSESVKSGVDIKLNASNELESMPSSNSISR